MTHRRSTWRPAGRTTVIGFFTNPSVKGSLVAMGICVLIAAGMFAVRMFGAA